MYNINIWNKFDGRESYITIYCMLKREKAIIEHDIELLGKYISHMSEDEFMKEIESNEKSIYRNIDILYKESLRKNDSAYHILYEKLKKTYQNLDEYINNLSKKEKAHIWCISDFVNRGMHYVYNEVRTETVFERYGENALDYIDEAERITGRKFKREIKEKIKNEDN